MDDSSDAGPFRGRSAKFAVDPGLTGQVTLRLIPRINYASTKPFNEENLKGRPAPKLFDRDEAERLSNEAAGEKNDTYTGERYYEWRGQTFAYGMLYKKMSARQLDTDIGQVRCVGYRTVLRNPV